MYIVSSEKDILLNSDSVSFFYISDNHEIIAKLKNGKAVSLGNYHQRNYAVKAMSVLLEDTKFSSKMCYLPSSVKEKKGVLHS